MPRSLVLNIKHCYPLVWACEWGSLGISTESQSAFQQDVIGFLNMSELLLNIQMENDS